MQKGKKNIDYILKNLNPRLNPDDYIFTIVNSLDSIDINEILAYIRESEGISLIMKKSVADFLQVPYFGVWSWITLDVHSSLDAVGLTSVVSNAFSEIGLSCNIVAGYHHDHIFIQKEMAEKAMNTLAILSSKKGI